ncbi:MAG: TAXI family TRAP transporter solute-binding subunit [Acetivibrionales bacterium]|jgi:TRAP transporter TAXI family solute receptor
MKKKMFVTLAIMVLVAMLVGCAGSSTSPTPSASAAPSSSAPSDTSEAPKKGGIVPTEVTIVGGTTGGSWNIATTIISNFLPNEIPGIRTTALPGAALSNLASIQSGDYHLSMSKLPTTVDALNGLPPFEGKQDKIRNLGFAYDEATHIVVAKDSDIYSVEDLKGKKLTTFVSGNTAEIITRHILQVYGMSYNDLGSVSFSNLTDMGEQFKDGLTDALCFGSAIPVAVIMDIASVRDIRILEIPDDKLAELQKISPAYMRNVIPAGTYKGVDQDIRTLGNAQHFIVSSDLDEDFVYEMTKAIVKHLDEIGDGHAAYKGLTPEIMAKDLGGVEMHPGAARYYKEIGAIK